MKNILNHCSSCKKSNATLQCGICQNFLCKKCKQFNDDDLFSFLPKIPAELSHNYYCGHCYDEKVAPEIAAYNETMELAKNIATFSNTQGKETRLMGRTERPLKVENCIDREETLLRLAFLAVYKKFNAIIDVAITSEKTVNGGYQKLSWSGTAVPTQIDKNKLRMMFDEKLNY